MWRFSALFSQVFFQCERVILIFQVGNETFSSCVLSLVQTLCVLQESTSSHVLVNHISNYMIVIV